MSKLHELAELGQSVWLDYIRRNMLDSGELNQLRVTGVRGVTSNPSIFEKAIGHSDDYDDDFNRLVAEGKEPLAIFEALAVEDIQRACDIFADLYRQTDGGDGYVSLEVNPNLAYDTQATVEEARRLFAAVDRPNAYIKVPASPQGIPAIRQLISDGVNVNVTLIFALTAYEAVAEAYIAGLEDRLQNGQDISRVTSVASFFVSRVDTKVDNALDAIGRDDLRGKIGIANAKMAYQRFLQIFGTERWERLAEEGARVQRPLWGSTSTKDPAYPDTLYVDSLIGPDTVNTVPPETLELFLDHGTVECTLEDNVEEARQSLARLAEAGISLDAITDQLLAEGVDKFAASFNSLMDTIATRRQQVLDEGRRHERQEAELGEYEQAVQERLQQLDRDNVLQRLWDKDHTLWADEPTEITNRLGWLTSAETMLGEVEKLESFAANLKQEGYTHALLLGMGGSSLAPELFARTFAPSPGHLNLSVLDSTDPGAVSAYQTELDPQRTLFIVSSKSGSTIETLSFFKYFYTWVSSELGAAEAGKRFIAITDPGSHLAELAEKYNFRTAFLNDPNIGGRYSALSYFGLVPAALMGVDLRRLLQRAAAINRPQAASQGAYLGAVLGELAQAGRNKVTFIISPEIAGFGDWVEQLLAESTGKSGRGLLPIIGEPPTTPEAYQDDRIFIYMPLGGGTSYSEEIADIAAAGFPVVTVRLDDVYDVGRQFIIWEIATAVIGHILGIHPFNQPNVESAKRLAKEMYSDYGETGSLPEQSPRIKSSGITVHEVQVPADTPIGALKHFLEYAREGGYVAVQAYLQPTPATDVALLDFSSYLREKTGLAVTTGYGPRFLHSTGQLHKGDEGKGLFIQLVSEPLQDLPIPDEPGSSDSSISFGVLKLAQALGDARALREAERHVIRFQLRGDVPTLLAYLQQG